MQQTTVCPQTIPELNHHLSETVAANPTVSFTVLDVAMDFTGVMLLSAHPVNVTAMRYPGHV